jgi:hypothetical protein
MKKETVKKDALDPQLGKVDIDETPQKVNADLRKYNRAEAAVNKALANLETVQIVDSPETLETLTVYLKEAKGVETLIEDKRKALGKPFADAKKKIDDYAKNLVASLTPAITKKKDLVLAYNKKLEEDRINKRTQDRVDYLVLVLGFTGFPEKGTFEKETVSITKRELSLLDDNGWKVTLQDLVDKLAALDQAKIDDLNKAKEDAAFFGDEVASQETDKKIEEIRSAVPPPHVPAFGPSKGSSGSSSVKGITKTWTFDITDETLIPREYLIPDPVKIREAIQKGERSIAGLNIYQKEGFSLR